MIYEKQISVEGKYAKKNEDIKNGDIIEILDEGTKTLNKFNPESKQDTFRIKASRGEYLININKTSLNNLIDCYGNDSKSWIGKKVKVWLIQDFKDGKLIWKLYLTHPGQVLGQSFKNVNDELQEQRRFNDIPTVESESYDERA